jgi:predicted dehydrogenase
MEKLINKSKTTVSSDFKRSESISEKRITRRSMLKAVAKSAIGLASIPVFIPSSVLGLAGKTPPSDRITIGVIGCGRKAVGGTRNFQALGDHIEIIALSDPNDLNLENLADECGLDTTQILTTRDFREVIDHKGVDAVFICTPDHWHAIQAISAARAGKHLYCEKPMTNSIEEGRAVVNAVNRYNVVFQHGTQLKSLEGTRRACELVRNGRIGDIKTVYIGTPPGHTTGHHEPAPVPDWLDWELWQGPAPEAEFQPIRVGDDEQGLRGWYFISDYSKPGFLAGMGVHDMDIAQWGIGMEESGPVEIEGHGVFPEDGLFDTVLDYHLTFRYSNGVTIDMADTGKNRFGVLFEGTEGSIHTRGNLEISAGDVDTSPLKPGDTRLYESYNHEGNFIESVRSGKETITPVEVAHRSTSTCQLGAIALQLGRKLRWNPQNERFIDDEIANRMLSRSNRSPWFI